MSEFHDPHKYKDPNYYKSEHYKDVDKKDTLWPVVNVIVALLTMLVIVIGIAIGVVNFLTEDTPPESNNPSAPSYEPQIIIQPNSITGVTQTVIVHGVPMNDIVGIGYRWASGNIEEQPMFCGNTTVCVWDLPFVTNDFNIVIVLKGVTPTGESFRDIRQFDVDSQQTEIHIEIRN
jgi:hypothetical protein